MHLNVWQNRSLAFKIMNFQKKLNYLRFEIAVFYIFKLQIF
jgi:hypothetical protein